MNLDPRCQASQPLFVDGKKRIALVGNPNCGKTTLFNCLTGSKQRVGNWPGVTVERKIGQFCGIDHQVVEVVDLPGLYSLNVSSDAGAVDEKIAITAVKSRSADIIVNIVDASNLERHLYLTIQLLERGLPVILALNMMDVAQTRGVTINLPRLSEKLGCPVIALSANKGRGLAELKEAIARYCPQSARAFALNLPASVQAALKALTQSSDSITALTLLEDEATLIPHLSTELLSKSRAWQTEIQQQEGEDADILIAEARYTFINGVLAAALTQSEPKATWTNWIDRIVLNRVLSLPIFLGVMYFLFFFTINIGGAFQDFFDIGSETLFVNGLAHGLTAIGSPTWLTVLLANGVGKGINTTITFIPVIGALFLFLAFLEDSGYMARAAFVVDRLMRALGLPGKAFVPMIVGFGCNVPAVMAARTLENEQDRLLTIMMAPFMSCGARLAIFAMFTTAFFPKNGHNIVFALYLIGILMAVLTGFILRRTVLKGEASPLVMELPPYHFPHFKTLLLHAWHRLKSFVVRAGRLIIPICVIIGALNSFNINGTMNTGEGDAHSLLSIIGGYLTPLFSPMGLKPDNWPATVGLVTGVLAKEVVVGTLNTLYSQLGHFAAATNNDFQLWAGLKEAWNSIYVNFAALQDAFSNPVLAKAPIDPVDQGVLGLIYQKFDGQIGAFAYLLFILLYFPCISTTAAMLREVNRGWVIFSMCWTTGVAYATAVVFYQAATFTRHPYSATGWIMVMTFAFFGTIFVMRKRAERARLDTSKLKVSSALIGGGLHDVT